MPVNVEVEGLSSEGLFIELFEIISNRFFFNFCADLDWLMLELSKAKYEDSARPNMIAKESAHFFIGLSNCIFLNIANKIFNFFFI